LALLRRLKKGKLETISHRSETLERERLPPDKAFLEKREKSVDRQEGCHEEWRYL